MKPAVRLIAFYFSLLALLEAALWFMIYHTDILNQP
jgi:hypothetical protein